MAKTRYLEPTYALTQQPLFSYVARADKKEVTQAFAVLHV
jgi:hypothetical protein